MRSRTSFAALSATAILVLSAPLAQANTSFSNLYVFGDSLSDVGNISSFFGGLIPLPPYAPGRFSDGDVWVEYLAADLGLGMSASENGGTNYAWGGAVTGGNEFDLPPLDLTQQTGRFLTDTGGAADSGALYVVWGGGNDVRDENTVNSIDNLEQVISDLAAAGAENFLVPNLPNIGLTPESLGDGSSAVKEALTIDFNAGLEALIDELNNSLAINIVLFDVFDLFDRLVNDPAFAAAFGLTNVNEACFTGVTGLGGEGDVCANPDEYVFWDGIHPTTAAHGLLADFASDALTAVPVPAALPLFLAALGWLGLIRRRA